MTELENHIKDLDKEYLFVTACGKGGGRSSDAAKLLKKSGYNANWLCGGTYQWLNIK